MTVSPAPRSMRNSPIPCERAPSITHARRKPGRVLVRPGQQLGRAFWIGQDRELTQHPTHRVQHRGAVGVQVSVHADDGLHTFCQD